ncbi:MAG: DUF692 domain-containing protein [Arenimonas sp.]|nr:DUF692 domain-containing protein [Arenimonas sp.]
MRVRKTAQGAGLGFRRELLTELSSWQGKSVDFFEIAPENWATNGGRFAKDLRRFTERYAFVCHGLSLSIGSTDALDVDLVKRIKKFMSEHRIGLYTEHLSWCSHNGHLYDLLPIPCTQEAVDWVSARVRQVQDILGMQIGLENASYYLAPPGAEMKEQQFISEIIRQSDCLLHLDVNNVYVNSQNFNFDPKAYLDDLPLDKVCYLHVAGHYQESDGFLVDTHGADVIDPVWDLLDYAYQSMGAVASSVPTCLERDFNFPPLSELMTEVEMIRTKQQAIHTANIKRRA